MIRRRAAHPLTIAVSLALALLLNLLPWGRTLGIPDFIALVLLYWMLHEPHRLGLMLPFLLGLLMDVQTSSTLGEHALLYVLLCHLTSWLLSNRVREASQVVQMLHLLPLMLLAQLCVVLVRQATGAPLPDWGIVLPWVTTTLLWPLVSLLLPMRARDS